MSEARTKRCKFYGNPFVGLWVPESFPEFQAAIFPSQMRQLEQDGLAEWNDIAGRWFIDGRAYFYEESG